MDTVVSSDGTSIAYDRGGQGPPLILVDGALCHRVSGPSGPLAKRLITDFTVYTYDRRGRGDSTDTGPYAVEREIEDLGALIEAAGGSAYVYGSSSGATLALEAANRGLAISKLALYESPFIVDDSRPPVPDDFVARLDRLVAADDRAKAVRLFMTEGINIPAVFVATMRFMPAWPRLKRVAHTLPYDMAVLGDTQRGKPLPAGRWTAVTAPTLVMGGGKSPTWLRHAVQALADILPATEHRALPGQTHLVKPDAIAPPLRAFFTA